MYIIIYPAGSLCKNTSFLVKLLVILQQYICVYTTIPKLPCKKLLLIKLGNVLHVISDKPKFECDSKQYVKRGDTTGVLRCKVSFNPTPTEAKWKFEMNGQTHTLNFNETFGEFKAEQWVSFLYCLLTH